ncbi:MAG: BatD family protein [Pseudomonadales bacterium]|nr:BatD family protein [Pseudomonadales bacterium]
MVRNTTTGPLSSKRAFVSAFLLLAITLLAGNIAVADSFTASVNRNQLELNESFELTLSIDQQVFFGEPELDGIREHFHILGQSRNSQYRNINGESISSTVWSISLKPKNTGYLVIPPIEFKGLTSDAIAIEVKEPKQPTADENPQVFFETDIDRAEMRVQAQLLYKVRLYSAISMARANITEPKLERAIIHSLGDQLVYEAVKNGQRYQVHEWNYAIFPQQQGTLTIPAPILTATLSSRSSMYGRPISITTENQTIEVKPIPDSYPALPWIATPSLSATQQWDPDTTQIKVGDSISRTIGFNVTNNEASVIPALQHLDIDGVKTYPDKPQINDSATNQGIQGQRIEKIAYVVTKAGKLTLPEVAINWWNTDTQQLETTTLPAQTFIVEAAAIPANQPEATASINAPVQNEIPAPTGTGTLPDYRDSSSSWWILISGILLILLLGVTLLWWRTRNQLKTISAQLNTDTDSSSRLSNEMNASEKQAFSALQKSCSNQQTPEIWKDLISWAQQYWETSAIHSTDDIVRRLPAESELATIIQQLDSALFSPSAKPFSEADQLISLVGTQRKTRHKSKNPTSDDALKPLYPL